MTRRAFTLLEIVAVVVVLALLSGFTLPRYFSDASRAKESQAKAALGSARAAIAGRFAAEILESGHGQYPTMSELASVLGTLPSNPFNGSASVSRAAWRPEAPPVEGEAGWNYDPDSGRFWLNSASVGEQAW